MLVFSTILNINPTMTKPDFVRTVIQWVMTNPRPVNVIPGIEWNGSFNVRYGNDRLWLEILEYAKHNIIAARFEKIADDGIVWDTDYIMNFNDMKMSVRLDRTYTDEETIEEDDGTFATPHFISILIEKGYLRKDGILPITRTPIMITEDNLSLAAYAILGDTDYYLPVVYVSKTFTDEFPVDINRMAARLKGAAHVLVQESNDTTTEMRRQCDGMNPYNGAIGVYYPDPDLNPDYIYYKERFGSEQSLSDRVVNTVLNYANAIVPDPLYTWLGIRNGLLQDRLEIQKKLREEELINITAEQKSKEQATLEAEQLIAEFDEDMKAMQLQIDELSRTAEKLQFENHKLKSRLDAGHIQGNAVLYTGKENDYYPGEIKDLVLSVLNDSLPNIQPESRRKNVVEDLISSNEYERSAKAKAEEVKRLFNNFDGMNGKLIKDLEKLGFTVEYNGKHYKLKYHDDDRYIITIASSPSDKARSGKNDAHTIINKVF